VKDGQLLVQSRASAANAFTLALLAGFVATVVMLLAFAVAFGTALLLGRVPLPVVSDWFRGLTNNPLIDTAGPNLYAATAIFFLGGVLWALLYGVIFEPRMHGAGWRRGVQFAMIPWLISLVVVLPIVGGGVLGMSLGAGPLPVLGNLILHVVYGAILGGAYAAAESVMDQPLHRADAADMLAARVSELGAARGIIGGLAIGVVLGILGTMVVPQAIEINPLAMVVAVGLTGAAFGGFVGSLSAT
jgi:hypothetical protein